MHEILHPKNWKPAQGYANGIKARGTMIFLGGQVGWDENQQFHSDDFVAQSERALENIVAILAEAGAGPEHLVRLTWFVTSRQAYLASRKALGAVYQRVIGAHYPAMSLVEVSGLLEARAIVEIEATAVIPD